MKITKNLNVVDTLTLVLLSMQVLNTARGPFIAAMRVNTLRPFFLPLPANTAHM